MFSYCLLSISLFALLASLAIEDFRSGIGGDPIRDRRGLNSDSLVKARLELPYWPVHKDDGGALGDTDDEPQPVVNADDVVDTEPEWMPLLQNESEKLALIAIVVHGMPSRIFRMSWADNMRFGVHVMLLLVLVDVV
jgi:hypothetical protein